MGDLTFECNAPTAEQDRGMVRPLWYHVSCPVIGRPAGTEQQWVRFNSIGQAAEYTGASRGHIHSILKGNGKTSGGWEWKHAQRARHHRGRFKADIKFMPGNKTRKLRKRRQERIKAPGPSWFNESHDKKVKSEPYDDPKSYGGFTARELETAEALLTLGAPALLRSQSKSPKRRGSAGSDECITPAKILSTLGRVDRLESRKRKRPDMLPELEEDLDELCKRRKVVG
jgi:hypothetical protein